MMLNLYSGTSLKWPVLNNHLTVNWWDLYFGSILTCVQQPPYVQQLPFVTPMAGCWIQACRHINWIFPEQGKNSGGKNKKVRRKNKGSGDINSIDEVFMPRSESDIEGGEMDEFERELEEFKR